MNISAILLRLAGLVFLALALLYNKFAVGLLHPSSALEEPLVDGIRQAQLIYLLLGTGLLSLAALIRRIGLLDRITSRNIACSIVLLLTLLLLPATIMELALRPFSDRPETTTIFLPDADLGWRLRPSHQGVWGGVPVTINNKGLRGPEHSYNKSPGKLRILYLGDSVTFGYGLSPYETTFPSRIGDLMEKELGIAIETINSGVGGYSPWQEYKYLSTEGIKYQPDLVVVSFVLNDVTEKFRLLRFGGDWSGYQIAHSATSLFDTFSTKSAIVFAIRQWGAKARFGSDIQPGAVNHEALNDWSLIKEADTSRVQQAWDMTLENMGNIANFCGARKIPMLLIAFPSTYQFLDPERYSIPQAILMEFGRDQGIETIDLLELLGEHAAARATSPFDYFLDENHLSAEGSAVVAELVAPVAAASIASLPPGPKRDSEATSDERSAFIPSSDPEQAEASKYAHKSIPEKTEDTAFLSSP